MIYVGSRLPTAVRWPDRSPALIDPQLPVGRSRSGLSLGYWPSYGKLSPDARAGFLTWLAEGRRDPRALIGFAFVFFYGLERRVLLDARHDPERCPQREFPELLNEIRELLEVYGYHRSFRSYASQLRNVLEVETVGLDLSDVEPPQVRAGREMPLRPRIALGTRIADGKPIPPEWAYSWYVHHPLASPRTARHRCPDEFRSLFLHHYRDEWGDAGMVTQGEPSRRAFWYNPASEAFSGPLRIPFPHDVSDPLDINSGGFRRLEEIATRVCDELGRYSRHVGRREDRWSLAALALLPKPVLQERKSRELDKLRQWAEAQLGREEMAIADPAGLIQLWPERQHGKLSSRDARNVAALLEHIGYGIEPDCRYSRRNFCAVHQVAVFRIPEGLSTTPGDRFEYATLFVHLSAYLCMADDGGDGADRDVEADLEAQLGEVLKLSPGERLRLRAHLRWLLANPPTLRGVRRRAQALEKGVRRRIGITLLTVAAANGRVTARQVAVLTKIYPILGLEAGRVNSDLHTLAAASRPSAATGPVTVIEGEACEGYLIPEPEALEDGVLGHEIDLERVAAVQAETRVVFKVLDAILAGEDEVVQPEVTKAQSGLDEPHRALIQRVAERDRWDRAGLDAIADELGLLVGGAIEVLNEAAFERCDEPLLEGNDPVTVNPNALKEMLP
jgi:hypothetical protein